MNASHQILNSFLNIVRDKLNEALRNEKQNVAEHVEHPPFEFDYIKSETVNASAITIGGRSFIGITMPLVHLLLDTCARLGKSEAVAEVLGVGTTIEDCNAIHALVFQTQLMFVVSHEYTHHVHGHLSKTPGTVLGDNASQSVEDGSLPEQVIEIDADGYAVFHVLAHLIAGEGRLQAIAMLGCDRSDTAQDTRLLSLFVIALGAFLFVRPPVVVDQANILKLKYPPQSVRMDFIMRNAVRWIRQNRPHLELWITPDKFQMLMRIAAGAVRGMNGGKDWEQQVNFVKSESGSEYLKKLGALVDNHIQPL